MRFLDKIALNRLIAILTSFILGIIKIFAPNKSIDDIVPPPPKVPLIKRRKKQK